MGTLFYIIYKYIIIIYIYIDFYIAHTPEIQIKALYSTNMKKKKYIYINIRVILF